MLLDGFVLCHCYTHTLEGHWSQQSELELLGGSCYGRVAGQEQCLGKWLTAPGRNVAYVRAMVLWSYGYGISSELSSADKRHLAGVKHNFWAWLPLSPSLSLLTGVAALPGVENTNSLILGVEQCDIINKSNGNLFTECQLVLSFLREWRLGRESRSGGTT